MTGQVIHPPCEWWSQDSNLQQIPATSPASGLSFPLCLHHSLWPGLVTPFPS